MINKERMERAITYLRKVQDNGCLESNWDMWEFGRREECGTSACAFGHIILSSEFPELIPVWIGKVLHGAKIQRPRVNGRVPGGSRPIDNMHQLAMKFFGITKDQSWNLFEPARYPVYSKDITPAMVADRMEAMLG